MTDGHRCKCGCCKAMSMQREPVCCHDIEEIKSLIECFTPFESRSLGWHLIWAISLQGFQQHCSTYSFCYETVELEILTEKERHRCSSFPANSLQFYTACAHFTHSASSRGNSCKLYPLLLTESLTELQPVVAQHLDMIKLSCKVSTSC